MGTESDYTIATDDAHPVIIAEVKRIDLGGYVVAVDPMDDMQCDSCQ